MTRTVPYSSHQAELTDKFGTLLTSTGHRVGTTGKNVAIRHALRVGDGTVTFDVDHLGYVVNATATGSSSTKAEKAALQVVRSFRYSPGIADGRPVKTKALVFLYDF